MQVGVREAADDAAINARLTDILRATGWFEHPAVETRSGVVFLSGTATDERRRQWAGDLARNTEDVVAVVNRMELAEVALWDLSPAFSGLRELVRKTVRALPNFGFALVVLLATWVIGRLTRAGVYWVSTKRLQNELLRRVVARVASTLVLLLGVYIVLQVSGLTRLAATVLGGTGLLGLVLGIAFRDISENFLASLFLSIQQPFRRDDLVEIDGVVGYVERTTFRSTVLMTLDGNHVQVPNATVYKAVIRNFTSNPKRREQFDVGIGYDVPISHAQEVMREVLNQHPAVLADPEPWVLVDSLGSATVMMRVYFWLDGTQHSWLKVRSSVIRLVKRALQEACISMPDEAREVVFPDGVPLRLIQADAEPVRTGKDDRAPERSESTATATGAEGTLGSDAHELIEQARSARSPEGETDLLGRG